MIIVGELPYPVQERLMLTCFHLVAQPVGIGVNLAAIWVWRTRGQALRSLLIAQHVTQPLGECPRMKHMAVMTTRELLERYTESVRQRFCAMVSPHLL